MSGRYDYILFDLDGTLTDSSPGIINGFEYALTEMGLEVPERSTMKRFVGPPLTESFGNMLGLSEEDTQKAITVYRKYYFELGGVFENSVYDGVVEMLEVLKGEGRKLIVCTSKNARGTNKVLEHFDLLKYFDFVGTSDDIERPGKIDVINYIIKECSINDLKKAVMVGDRHYDITAAKEAGMDSIGILYGYGDEEELSGAGATYIAATCADVVTIV